MGFIAAVVFVAIVCAIASWWIASARMGQGSKGTGVYFVLGLILGVFGILIACFAPKRKPNPTYAPGWYPDPHGQAQQRWYDGQAWTDHTHAG